MLEGDLDDLVGGKVCGNGGVLATLADDIGLVGFLAVHAEAVLVAVDCDGLEGQLVGGAEDANGDLAAVGDEQLLELHNGAIGAQALVYRVGVAMGLAVLMRRAKVVLLLAAGGAVGAGLGLVALGHVGHGGRRRSDG